MRLYIPSSDIDEVPRLLSNQHLLQQGRHGLGILINLSLHSRLLRRIRYSDQAPVQMWDHWLPFLLRHVEAVEAEIARRGAANRTLKLRLRARSEELDKIRAQPLKIPTWMAWDRLFETHRAMLLRVGGPWYRRHGWLEPPASVPVWPALLPEIGETMMAPDQSLWTVGAVDSQHVRCLQSDVAVVDVPTYDVYTRRWQRVIEE